VELEVIYTTYRPLLISVSYRMLGSLTDAEDIVQDVFLSMQRVSLNEIEHLKAYLVKMTTNRCLNLLNSSRKQREIYPGNWLPEPDITDRLEPGPEERTVLEETVTYALLVLLQQLSPMERAVYILRKVLGFDYKELADMLDKTEAACRKMYSRVKPKILQAEIAASAAAADEHTGHFVEAFLQASRSGSFEPFIRLLVEDSILLTDGGGKVRAALLPITGRARIQAFWEGIFRKGAFDGEHREVRINGEAGVLLIQQGKLKWTVSFEMAADLSAIQTIYVVSNPDKLQRFRLLG
jgi:RNA polymerase sigma-70 factor (ECF subfamily)